MNSEVVIIGDPHLEGGSPRSRIDEDYLGNCLEEIGYLASVSEHLVFLGDLLQRPTLTNEAELRILSYFNDLRSKGNRIYSIIGNHDIFSMNLQKGYRDSKLAVLEEAGAVKILRHGERYDIGGLFFTVLEMGRGPVPPAQAGVQEGDFVLAHYFFGSRGSADPAMTITEEMLNDLPRATYFFGHDHEPDIPYHLENGGVVYRPGSLARNTAQPFNLDRTPLVYVIDPISQKVSPREVACLPGSEVFSPDVFRKKKVQDNELFRASLDALVEQLGQQTSSKVGVYEALDSLECPDAEKEYLRAILTSQSSSLD